MSTSLVVCNIAASSSSSCPRRRARCSCNQPAGSLRNHSALPASPASGVEIQRSRRPGIRVAISINEFRAFKQWNQARNVFEGAFHLIQVSVMISHQVKSRCELNSSFSSEVNSFVRNFLPRTRSESATITASIEYHGYSMDPFRVSLDH